VPNNQSRCEPRRNPDRYEIIEYRTAVKQRVRIDGNLITEQREDVNMTDPQTTHANLSERTMFYIKSAKK